MPTSKVVILLLWVYCLVLLILCARFLCLALVLWRSSLCRKRELVDFLLLYFAIVWVFVFVCVLFLFLVVPLVGMLSLIVVFPGHTY